MAKYAPVPLWKSKSPWKHIVQGFWSDFSKVSWRPVSPTRVEICITVPFLPPHSRSKTDPDTMIHGITAACGNDWGFHLDASKGLWTAEEVACPMHDTREFIFTFNVLSTPTYP